MNPRLCHWGRMAVLAVVVLLFASSSSAQDDTGAIARADPITLETLLTLSPQQLANVDIAAANLACAQGLDNTGDEDTSLLLEKLDLWAEMVRSETEGYRHKFDANKSVFGDSESQYKMLVLVTVLMQDLGVQYNAERAHEVDFTRSQDLFLTGLLTSGAGTCVSLPVLYAAVGRRLGYPLKLVEAPEHLFLRWDDPKTGERFNIDATSRGLVIDPDEHYQHWPRKLTSSESKQKYYLRSLSPSEELAVFLTTRGHALHDMGKLTEAISAYQAAMELSPKSIPARAWLSRTTREIKRQRTIASDSAGVAKEDRFRP